MADSRQEYLMADVPGVTSLMTPGWTGETPVAPPSAFIYF